jgi:hypothetical protein
MEVSVITVRDRLAYITSTAFTDVPLVVGTPLAHIMALVEYELNDHPELTAHRSVDYDITADWYSMEWYHKIWMAIIKPIAAEYLQQNMPGAWFRQYYQYNLNPN